MRDLNRVCLIGRTGDDVQLHFFDGSTNCVGRVSLATQYEYKKQSGEEVKETEWHNLLLRNKTAEIVAQYCKKGSKIYVEGRLKYRSYQKDGVTKYYTEIEVTDFQFIDSKNQNTAGQNPAPPAEAPAANPVNQKDGDYTNNFQRSAPDEHDDLPF